MEDLRNELQFSIKKGRAETFVLSSLYYLNAGSGGS